MEGGGFSRSGPLVKCMISSFLGWMLKLMSVRAFSRMGKAFWSLVVLMEREEDEVRRTPSSTLEMPGETSETKSPKDPKKGETQRKRAELNRRVN